MSERYLDVQEFTYELPDERIARYPLAERDASKLLIYSEGKIAEKTFRSLPDVLPDNSHLVFNNTKVIAARLLLSDGLDLKAEVFLLEPAQTEGSLEQAMTKQGHTIWHCMVGGLKKWRKVNKTIMSTATATPTAEDDFSGEITLSATLLADSIEPTVQLSWLPAHLPFGKVLSVIGNIPLPPYLKRQADKHDAVTYQTVYAKHEGAVAAPTAGLHFTERVLADLKTKGHQRSEVTLHVSAGTFAPIKTTNALSHAMHRELVIVELETLQTLSTATGPIIPVGTTSMRTLESLYWFGVQVMIGQGPEQPGVFMVDQHFAYSLRADTLPDFKTSYEALVVYATDFGLSQIVGQTEIYIYPGYELKVCRGIVTNFHQPGSTLMLLIAALVGDNWRQIYDYALRNDFRFLSYGDSSLLLAE